MIISPGEAMMIKSLGFIALACLFFPAVAFSEYNNFRCGHELVSLGDTSGRVFMECGEPTWKEMVGYRDGLMDNQLWYYNCGSSDFLYILHFVGGKLKQIESEGYGTGQSDCYGPRIRR
jgi:hypothetical protein